MRLLITSISCRDTVWTTSFLFCSSPSGHCTNRVYKDIAKQVHGHFKYFFPKCEIKNAAVKFYRTVSGYLSSHCIIVSGSGEGAAQLGDLSSSFINGNNVSDGADGDRQWLSVWSWVLCWISTVLYSIRSAAAVECDRDATVKGSHSSVIQVLNSYTMYTHLFCSNTRIALTSYVQLRSWRRRLSTQTWG